MKKFWSVLLIAVMVIGVCLPTSGAMATPQQPQTATVEIDYCLEGHEGTMIHEPYIATLPIGETYEVASPDIEGYQLLDSEQASLSGIVSKDITYEVKYTYDAAKFAYHIRYVGKNSQGDEVVLDEIEGEAPEGKVAVPAKEFVGWERISSEDLSLQVSSDNQANKTIYYKKVNKPYIIFQTGGSYVPPITAEPGADISEQIKKIKKPTKEGYEFAGWEIELPTTMPAEDLVVQAKWNPGSTTYQFIRWEQTLDGRYEIKGSEIRSATTGEEVTATEADKSVNPEDGYSFKSAETTIAEADGSSVVNAYYDLATWTINFHVLPETYSDDPVGDWENINDEVWESYPATFSSEFSYEDPELGLLNYDRMAELYQAKYDETSAGVPRTFVGFLIQHGDGSMQITDLRVVKDRANAPCTMDVYPLFLDMSKMDIFYLDYIEEGIPGDPEYIDSLVTTGVKDASNPVWWYYGCEPGFTWKDGQFRAADTKKELENAEWQDIVDGQNDMTVDSEEGLTIRPSEGHKLEKYIELKPKRKQYTLYYMSNDKEVASEHWLWQEQVDLTRTLQSDDPDLEFVGWQLEKDHDTIDSVKMSDNQTVYAVWKHKDRMVTFDTQGGSEVPAQTVAYNTPATMPKEPTRDGYMFSGWYLASDNDNERWAFDRPVDENITLYAHWQPIQNIPYTIEHIIQGEETPFYTEQGGGLKNDTVYADALTPQDENYPENAYLESTQASQTITLEEGKENKVVFNYVLIGQKDYTVSYLDTQSQEPVQEDKKVTTLNNIVTECAPDIDGYEFVGDQAFEVKTLSVNSDENHIVFYYEKENSGVTPPPVDPGEPGGDDDEDKPDDNNPPALNTEDHFSYVVGYEDGMVKPQRNITRAEVSSIFYRLLEDDVRDKNTTNVSEFSDVSASDWYGTTVATLSKMGIVKGYEDGTFRPNAPITRAEFAAIATRFFEETGAEYEPGTFTDVTGDEWFAGAIQDAVNLGLIGGYEDGTVRPNNNITRAEACAIVNRTLGRVPDADHLLPADEMKTWPDNKPSDWFYADMQEATNGHEYEWIKDHGNKVEQWTKIMLDNDWEER